MRKPTFWNTTQGAYEKSARRSIKAADLSEEDAAAVQALIGAAKLVDHVLKEQAAIGDHAMFAGGEGDAFGDTKFAWHVKNVQDAYWKALEHCLLTPKARIAAAGSETVSGPFTSELADVRSIMRD